MNHSLEKITNFLLKKANEIKPQIDRFMDPAMLFIGSNALGAYLIEQGANMSANTMNSFEEITYYGLTTIGTIGLIKANRHKKLGIIPATKRLYKKRTIQASQINGIKPIPKKWNWAKTALLIGLTTLAGFQANKSLDRLIHPSTTLNQTSRKEQDDRTLNMAGYKLSGLYSDLTGIHGIVPNKFHSNTNHLMLKAWKRKKIRSLENKVVEQTIKERVEPFLQEKKTYVNLDEAINLIDEAIDPLKKELNWELFGKSRNLNEKNTNLVKEIANSITGKTLMSYAMTELLPEANGMKNKAVMDYIYRSNGKEFLDLFPALGDNLTSFGTYQFTSNAVFDSKKRVEGASRVNKFLPKNLQIPGSVIKLKGNDHDRAAFLFAVNNIALYLQLANNKNVESLRKVWKENDMIITQYIATAHHSPKLAIRSLNAWLKNPEKNYESVAIGRLKSYAKKTKENLNALLSDSFEQGPYNPDDRVTGIFEDLNDTNSAGYHMFSFIAPKNISLNDIYKQFRKRNKKFCLEGVERVVDYDGNPVQEVYEGEQVFVLTAPFKDTGKKNSQGKELFVYKPLKNETEKQVIERFKKYSHGMFSQPDLTDKFGKPPKIQKGKQIYVRAYKY